MPLWEEFVELRDQRYRTEVSVAGWLPGTCRADVVRLGGLVQHPVSTVFSVRSPVGAPVAVSAAGPVLR